MLAMLAQIPSAGVNTYFSLAKIITVLVLFVGWAFASQWVDRDTERVKTRREWWNLLVLGGGLGGFAVLVLFPWSGATFFVGLAFWAILGAGTLGAYVVHRNGRMVPTSRVLTPGHFNRVLAGVRGDKKVKQDKGIRVRMVDGENNPIEKPSDVEELEQFDLAQDFLFDMLWKRATDVDVLISSEKARVVYKIDGVVSEQSNRLTPEEAERLLTFLKRSVGSNIEERRRPQTGRMRVGLLGSTDKPESLTVVTSASTKGERLRLKLNRAAGLMKLENLGFSADRLAQYKKLVELDSGLVLFVGPKDSGITTLQYATLRAHDAYMQNIYTVEAKPQLKLDNVTQYEHDPSRGEASFARTLQTVIRREPDVVLVEQCEDRETAQLACRAATDKKIYLTIRAANSIDAVSKLQALVEDGKLVAAALEGVVAQRLIRVLCPACREAYKPDEALLHKANLPLDQIEHFYRPPGSPIVDKKGREIICQTCQNSHYVGRTGIFELLVISKALKKLIAEGAPAKRIKGQARAEKLRYLQEDGVLKVIDGITSVAEVMRGARVNGK